MALAGIWRRLVQIKTFGKYNLRVGGQASQQHGLVHGLPHIPDERPLRELRISFEKSTPPHNRQLIVYHHLKLTVLWGS